MNEPEILVIDDEQEMLISYEKILKKEGYNVTTTISAEKALGFLKKSHNYSLIICDLKMPEMDGMTFLAHLKEQHPHLPVIMVTGYGTLDSAIEAVKIGAFDFIEKPFSKKKLTESVKKALEQIVLKDDNIKDDNFSNIIGKSKGMLQIFDVIKKVAYGNGNVMVTGESGVGKELIARSIHKNSLRRNRPMIPINCGGLPDTLFESELFGYEKGAFTGAFQAKPGLVELANGGTLFLDEICETSQPLQVKLLRMLEDRKIRRIGGKSEIPVDIRVVSATNRDMEEMLENGSLREDLFYRINTIQIHVPPLRDRKDDLALLISYFLNELNQKYDRQINEIDSSAKEILKNYHWPGNVRELQNVIERTYYLANPPTIKQNDLPSFLYSERNLKRIDRWKNVPYKDAKDLAIKEFEKDYLLFQLEKNSWNISKTAEICGMDRRTLHRLIKRYDLKRS
jgi:two-component system, NtrC family, response regulator AtoC